MSSSLKQLQCFLGFANFYSHFIRDYSSVAASLTRTDLCRGLSVLDPEAKQVFSEFKRCFNYAPVLVQPDHSCQVILEVGASDIGVGSVLSQWSSTDQKIHPCAFFPIPSPLLSAIMMWEIVNCWQWYWLWRNGDTGLRELNTHSLFGRHACLVLSFGHFNFAFTYPPGFLEFFIQISISFHGCLSSWCPHKIIDSVQT